MFQCQNLSFSYGENKVINNVSFCLKKNEIITILGSSGCGKTTLFRLMTGLEIPSHGNMYIEGKPISDSHDKITYMMQEDLLLPWRTAWDNMMLIADWVYPKPNKEKFQNKAASLLEEVGLKDCENLYPKEMSGGMRQRVSLARALIQERPLLLLDEPFGALDIVTREQMYQLLSDIKQKRNLSIVLITHDFKDALFLSDRIYVLNKAKGIVKEISVPKNLHDNSEKKITIQNKLRSYLT